MMYVLYIFLLVSGFLEKSIRFPYTAVWDLISKMFCCILCLQSSVKFKFISRVLLIILIWEYRANTCLGMTKDSLELKLRKNYFTLPFLFGYLNMRSDFIVYFSFVLIS